jgi:hypothetical protein
MFSKNLGVHRLWPDKDRLQSTDEFLEKRGPITKIGVQNLGFGLMEKTEPRAQEPFFWMVRKEHQSWQVLPADSLRTRHRQNGSALRWLKMTTPIG